MQFTMNNKLSALRQLIVILGWQDANRGLFGVKENLALQLANEHQSLKLLKIVLKR